MPAASSSHAHVSAPGTFVASARESMKGCLARWLGHFGAVCLTPRALDFPDVRAHLWRRRIAAQSKGFYSSLSDPADLDEGRTSNCYGVDFNPLTQRRFLRAVFPRYQSEYAALPLFREAAWEASPRFYVLNDAFQNIDAFAYWGLIRECRPARVVELGSGFSTLLAAQAVQVNGIGRVTAIDPYPREFITRNDLGIEVIVQRAETLPADMLLTLKANDIVFVDSSHVVRQSGDVLWFFHEVLPRLTPGVLVHVHDIHLPFDYPLSLVKARNVYWTEQYLLQSYLTKNAVDRVLFGSRYAAQSFPMETRAAFPTVRTLDGGSLWLQTG